jgi:hypothetical protein
MTDTVDTSAEAVGRKAAWLIAAARNFDLPAAARDVLEKSAATLRALAAERDALREWRRASLVVSAATDGCEDEVAALEARFGDKP